MKTEHSFIPPQQLVNKWLAMFEHCDDIDVLTEVAQWGADQELEACCEWLRSSLPGYDKHYADYLLAARRPKPPSLKEQALKALKNIDDACESEGFSRSDDTDIIRRALEFLPE